MVGFEKVLGVVKVIKDQIQYRSQSLLNLARDSFSFEKSEKFRGVIYSNFGVLLQEK